MAGPDLVLHLIRMKLRAVLIDRVHLKLALTPYNHQEKYCTSIVETRTNMRKPCSGLILRKRSQRPEMYFIARTDEPADGLPLAKFFDCPFPFLRRRSECFVGKAGR